MPRQMKRLVLHIGTHKTGTTSIQRYMAHMHDVGRQNGFVYPLTGRPTTNDGASWGHHVLSWSIRNMKGYSGEGYWKQVKEEIDRSNSEVAVISAEGFCRFEDHHVAKIKPFLEDYDVIVVIYLRNPLDYLVSSYKQRVKMGVCHSSFQTFVREFAHECDYTQIVNRWVEAFGQDKVIVKSYDKAKEEPGLLADFMHVVLGNDERYQYKPECFISANVSPSDEVVQVVRVINMIGQRYCRRSLMRTGVHRLRRAVLRGTVIERAMVYVMRPFISNVLVREDDRQWLTTRLSDAYAYFNSNAK